MSSRREKPARSRTPAHPADEPRASGARAPASRHRTYSAADLHRAIVHHAMLEPGLNFLQESLTPPALARKVRDVLDAT